MRIVGDGGNDRLSGTPQADKILGRGGADWLAGGEGNDTINGGAGDDTLLGEAGNDRLLGGAGDDVVVGGPGRDYLDGGAGGDVFGFDDKDTGSGSDADVIHGFMQEDILDLRDVDILFRDDYPPFAPARGGFGVSHDGGDTLVSWNTFGAVHTVRLAGFAGEPQIVWYDDDHPGGLGTGPTLADGHSLTGTLEVAEDTDWFRFDATAGRLYRFDVGGNAGGVGTAWSPTVSLRDGDGAHLSVNQQLAPGDYSSSDTRSYFAAAETGTYYLNVDSGWSDSGSGSYLLAASSRPYVDDVVDGETTIGAGQTFDGKIGYEWDEDWFRLTFEPGKVYTVEVRGESSGSGTLHDPALYIDDPEDEEGRLYDNDGGKGLDSRIVLNPEYWTTGTTALIGVRSFDDQAGTYKLVVTAEDAEAKSATATVSASLPPVDATADVPAFDFDLALPAAAVAAAPGELIVGGSGPDTLQGTFGSDHILGLGGSDHLSGGAGQDTIEGGTGNDYVSGQSGNDRLFGGGGSDHLFGGGGADVLVGGLGRDFLWGGAGADVFRFGAGDTGDATAGPLSDVIYDFGPDDVIDLRGAGVVGAGWPYATSEPEPGAFSIWYGGGSTFVSWNTDGAYHDVELASYTANGRDVYDQIVWYDDDYSDGWGTTATLADGQTLQGRIEVDSDQDWFRIDVLPGEGYFATLQTETSGIELDHLSAGSSGPRYVRVAGVGDVTGSYSVSLLVDEIGSDTRNHGTIAAGETFIGELEGAGDQDWYAIELTEGERYTIRLRGHDSGSGTVPDPFLRLIDDEGAWIRNNNDGGTGKDAKIVYTAEASGTYYIDAQDNSDGVGTYELHVTGTDALLMG